MSNIIAFEPKREGRAGEPRPAAGQILFFTGVRYERERDIDVAAVERTPQAADPVREAGRDAQAERLLA